eukprot:Plantae.Rhodophyta-Purpureofilum_apyrenoidigerum.ctg19015.p1 GENE.Plantae.Rhodophyta-Purpureofilum_apyrenoidigerum.ctg19015~~Plantae.Rhodophyta-Purpureofilum_apyrenoidigerum.ctg19015.p1  ORF type:complete len:207 (-),score=52.76 Plantae.Rhodophyta-Purpureofilum_apyrenoidigerum.ctg19015:58-678(-)
MAVGFVNGVALPTGARVAATNSRTVTMSAMSRRDMLKFAVAAAAAAALPAAPVLADGAVSIGTRFRVKGIYGQQILDLAGDVESIPSLISGEQWVKLMNLVSSSKKKPGSLTKAKNAFQLFKTGYFADSRQKQKVIGAYQSEFNDALEILEVAAKKKDVKRATQAAKELQQAFAQYIQFAELAPSEFADAIGQSFSSDYDYRRMKK